MPAPSPTYCTAADIRLYSNNDDFRELSDDEVPTSYVITDDMLNAKIVQAEVLIDSYGGYWNRANGPTQVRLYPRIEDAAVGVDIPEAIKQATIAQVEFIYENAPDIDHGITEGNTPTRQSISPRAKQYMHGFRRITGSVQLPWPMSPDITFQSEAMLESEDGIVLI